MQAWVIEFIQSWQYLGIGLLMLAENVFPPFPSEIILPFAGLLVSQHELSLLGVWFASTVGSLLGAFLWYGIGTLFPIERVVAWNDRHGAWLGLQRGDVRRAHEWFDHYGTYGVFFGRMIPGVRTLISLPAGSTRMPFLRFAMATIAGTMVWNIFLIGAGYLLRDQYEVIQPYIDYVLYGVIGLFLIIYFRRVWRQHHRNRHESAP